MVHLENAMDNADGKCIDYAFILVACVLNWSIVGMQVIWFPSSFLKCRTVDSTYHWKNMSNRINTSRHVHVVSRLDTKVNVFDFEQFCSMKDEG